MVGNVILWKDFTVALPTRVWINFCECYDYQSTDVFSIEGVSKVNNSEEQWSKAFEDGLKVILGLGDGTELLCLNKQLVLQHSQRVMGSCSHPFLRLSLPKHSFGNLSAIPNPRFHVQRHKNLKRRTLIPGASQFQENFSQTENKVCV